MTSRSLAALLGAALLTMACEGQHAAPDGRDLPHVTAALEETPPTIDDAAQGTYWGGRARQITLSNGAYTGPEGQRVQLLRQFYATGDLEGDGAVDTVVVLEVTDAGPETGHYVAVLRHLGTDTISLGTASLGHPVRVERLAVDGRRFYVDVVRTTPTGGDERARVGFELGRGDLVQVADERIETR